MKPTRPSFAAVTCARCFEPVCALRPPILTIAPAPLAFRCGRHALAQWNAPSSMTPSTLRHSVKRHLLEGALLAQRRVVDQIVDAAELLAPRPPPSRTRRPRRRRRRPPRSPCRRRARSRARPARPRSWLERTLTTIAAPPAASAFAMARPMLRPAPVTSATRPESSFSSLTSQLLQIDAAVIERLRQLQRGLGSCRHPIRRGGS